MTQYINLLHSILTHTSSNNFLIAYSGGLDSHVLLHAMAALPTENPAIRLQAIHVHHGLSPNADQWAQHCEQVCHNLKIPLQIFKINLEAARINGESLEAAARTERYKIFAQQLQPNQNLLTAHTQNDQAETLLLQLLRGAGPKGLAAMPIMTSFAAGFHLRPLLNNTRTQLEAYAHEHQLQWIEDESNLNPKFARNYLRHAVMPLLAKRWPALNETLSRSAAHCAEASELLDELAKQDLGVRAQDSGLRIQELGVRVQESGIRSPGFWLLSPDSWRLNTLSISALLKLTPTRQRNVIRYWLEQLQLPLPSTAKLAQLQHDVLHCAQDASPLVTWPGVEIRRYRDTMYAMPPLIAHDATIIISWDLKQPLILPNNLGVLTAAEIFTDHNFPTAKVTVRFRQGGETCRLKGHHCTSDLKKLFQQWDIPPWLRDRIPLIYVGDKLAVIVGYEVCE